MDSSVDRIIQLTFDLSRILRHIMTCVADEGTPVNFLQIHALVLIDAHPGLTMKELAEYLRVASPSATSFVGRLVKLGWVERERDDENRKLVRLRVTTEGKRVLREKKSKRVAAIKRILQLLSPQELRDLAAILEKLHGISKQFDSR